MKKLLAFGLIVLTVYSCSFSSKEKTNDAMNSPNEPASFKPLLTIGGCYAYEKSKDSVIGLLLISVSKDVDQIYYTFLVSGNYFTTIPSADQFKDAGVWGRKIPYFDNTQEPDIGFYGLQANETLITAAQSKLKLIDSLNVANTIVCSILGSIVSFDEIPAHITRDKEIKIKEAPLYQVPPLEVFKIGLVPIAKNNSEKAVAEVIWRFSKETSHPAAAALMKEEWYWSEVDEFSPFGNDEGSDAAYGFKTWRKDHPKKDPEAYIDDLEQSWGLSFAHKDIDDTDKLPGIKSANEFYASVDQSIIGVAFAQFALEGKVSARLKELAIKAIHRLNSEFSLRDVGSEYVEECRFRLKKMEKDLKAI